MFAQLLFFYVKKLKSENFQIYLIRYIFVYGAFINGITESL